MDLFRSHIKPRLITPLGPDHQKGSYPYNVEYFIAFPILLSFLRKFSMSLLPGIDWLVCTVVAGIRDETSIERPPCWLASRVSSVSSPPFHCAFPVNAPSFLGDLSPPQLCLSHNCALFVNRQALSHLASWARDLKASRRDPENLKTPPCSPKQGSARFQLVF